MARRRGLQDADASDVMQQVFLAVSRSISGWNRTVNDNQPPFRAWLSTIARNAITKMLVRRPKDIATGSSSVNDLLENQPDCDSTTSEILAEARREVIHWAVTQVQLEFSDETWMLFHQTAVEGVPIADVAKSTARSSGSIYIARYRVIARLKEKIREVSANWDL